MRLTPWLAAAFAGLMAVVGIYALSYFSVYIPAAVLAAIGAWYATRVDASLVWRLAGVVMCAFGIAQAVLLWQSDVHTCWDTGDPWCEGSWKDLLNIVSTLSALLLLAGIEAVLMGRARHASGT